MPLFYCGTISHGALSIFNTQKAFKTYFLLALLSIIPNIGSSQVLEGQWFFSAEDWNEELPPSQADLSKLEAVDKLPRTGGQFLYVGDLEITSSDRYVLDFAHTVYIGGFEYRLYDDQGQFLAAYKGGIESPETNPYPIRNGRAVPLEEGNYKLVTNLRSNFFITPPQPFIETEQAYLKAIKIGNLIAYTCLGIFFSMGIFYLCFAISRRNSSDLAYTVFIFGNLIFNTMSLNIAPDVFGIHNFQLATWPIFISSIAYLFFVRSLLQITRKSDPNLYLVSNVLIGLFVIFAILGFIFKNWSMELNRISVAIFLGYGFFAGLTYALQKVTLAYYYLIANLCFLVPAFLAILPTGFSDPTIYSAHLGIVAVSIEVLLLGLVQAYKINQMNLERLLALDKAEHSQKAALTDSLTGAPNRNAFETAFSDLSEQDSFTYIDLDGLKYYNDNFGHHRGDELLREFSLLMMNNLGSDANFFRIAGDEFGVISLTTNAEAVGQAIDHTAEQLRTRGFTLCGASYGQARYDEADSPFNLRKIADARMYSVKSRKKQLAAESH